MTARIALWSETSLPCEQSWLDSQAGQIGHSVAAAATFPRSCVAQALSRGDGPFTHYTLGRAASSIMKILFYFFVMILIVRHCILITYPIPIDHTD